MLLTEKSDLINRVSYLVAYTCELIEQSREETETKLASCRGAECLSCCVLRREMPYEVRAELTFYNRSDNLLFWKIIPRRYTDFLREQACLLAFFLVSNRSTTKSKTNKKYQILGTTCCCVVVLYSEPRTLRSAVFLGFSKTSGSTNKVLHFELKKPHIFLSRFRGVE